MSEVPNTAASIPLTLSSTLEEPPNDPGLNLQLKRKYSAKECFNQLHRYLAWLRSFIHKNHWVSPALRDQYKTLWDLYMEWKNKYQDITALAEFFSQKAHNQVKTLFQMYSDLRIEIEDLATQRVTMRQDQRADQMAFQRLRLWSLEGTANTNSGSPESDVTNPFSDPQDDSPFSNPQYP